MNIALNPEATADKSRETYRKTYDQFEVVTLDTAFPQAACGNKRGSDPRGI